MKQMYITIPLAIAYWFIPTEGFGNDALIGYLIFGTMLTIGALSDIEFKREI